MKNWRLFAIFLVTMAASAQGVYNYFPPPGITYSTAAGMTLGSPTGGSCGAGCLNAAAIEINGTPVLTASGTVTSVSVVPANGFTGTVANPTTTPAITLAPNFTGIAYSNGSVVAAAIASNFPTLNQSTTGNAATATALASTPSTCSSGYAAQGVLANGNATGCFQVFTCTTGSFAATLTGFSGTAPTGTIYYSLCGQTVWIYVGAASSILGTSNSTGMSISGVPSIILPSVQSQLGQCTWLEDNGTGGIVGVIAPNTSTLVLSLYAISGSYVQIGGPFTASGTKGLGLDFSCVYSLPNP